MIEITIDHNNNRVNIQNRIKNSATLSATSIDVKKSSTIEIRNLLSELFNIMGASGFQILEIDENTIKVFEEW